MASCSSRRMECILVADWPKCLSGSSIQPRAARSMVLSFVVVAERSLVTDMVYAFAGSLVSGWRWMSEALADPIFTLCPEHIRSFGIADVGAEAPHLPI